MKIVVQTELSFEPSNLAPSNLAAATGHAGLGMYLMYEMSALAFEPKLKPTKQAVFADV